MDYCKNRGITLLAYSALLSGAYTRKDRDFSEQYDGIDTQNRVKALNTVAKETGATANQVILAWMLQSEPPVVPLIAASTQEQMQENLKALETNLSPEQMDRLNNAGPQ
jgi:aryl-alcohol dehydrogenase-like predicted oxidoreductase